jgi:thymidine phosphorylase
MVPADKRLYALRDVTGTVPSLPLITASILSKKLAEGLDALVLDVKFGRAAFMTTADDARALAQAMADLGQECGVRTRALLTEMNTPLGRAAGNWLEVRESVACLAGTGPEDLRALVVECAAHLLVQTDRARALDAARQTAADCLASGAPRRQWDAMLAAQGADLAACARKLARDVTAPVCIEVRSERAGFVTDCDARQIGGVIRDLGGGRLTKESQIQPDVGVDAMLKPGEGVETGGVLARVHALDAASAEAARARVLAAYTVRETPPAPARGTAWEVVEPKGSRAGEGSRQAQRESPNHE